MVSFVLNGEVITLTDLDPLDTMLYWLRETKGLTGTKEGCNEGDCGACTVIEVLPDRLVALNACILFLGQMNGRIFRTVEAVGDGSATLHPVQSQMIENHGSQCGFCTPGFVMSLVAATANSADDMNEQIAGNLCRCTGYAPILRAAEIARNLPDPAWIAEDRKVKANAELRSLDEFANWYAANPDTQLIAGATDVGLWITKELRDFKDVTFMRDVDDLDDITETAEHLSIGANITLTDAMAALVDRYPSLDPYLKRYGSTQIRNAATLAGNIANASPIGDGNPLMLALDAALILRKGSSKRTLKLSEFFLGYKQTALEQGEFIQAVLVPHQNAEVRAYKNSKRFEQDISALAFCISVEITDEYVTSARIACGGMAAVAKRATNTEAALIGQTWSEANVKQAAAKLAEDFQPISDHRASAGYRNDVVQNLMLRAFYEIEGTPCDLFAGAL